MAHQLTPDAFGDPRNAASLLVASHLSYQPPELGIPAFTEQLGLTADSSQPGTRKPMWPTTRTTW